MKPETREKRNERRRAAHKSAREEKGITLARRRCDNCPKMFQPTKAWQRFCSDECRKMFHFNGSAYGKLKEQLTKLIEAETERVATGAIAKTVALAMAPFLESINSLTKENQELRKLIQSYNAAMVPRAAIGDADGIRIVMRAVERYRAKKSPAASESAQPGRV